MTLRLRWGSGLLVGLSILFFVAPMAGEDRGRTREDMPASMSAWIETLDAPMQRGAEARLRQMTPANRQRFFARWESLSQDDRVALQARLEKRAAGRASRGSDRWRANRLHTGSADERRAERDGYRQRAARWQAMDSADRKRMRHRLHRFQRLSPARQKAMIDRAMPDATADERAEALERMRLASERLQGSEGR